MIMLLALGHRVVEESSARKGTTTFKIFGFAESHPCARLCGRTRDDPEGHLDQRAAMRCSLVGFARKRWANAPDTSMAEAMRQRLAIAGEALPEIEAGCPGAWYRSRFADSLRPFLRRRGRDDPRRDVNPLLSPRTPTHILDALRLYEAHEDAAFARLHEREQQA